MTEPASNSTELPERPQSVARDQLPRAPGTWTERFWTRLRGEWPVWLVGGATLANGLLGVLSVLFRRFSERPQLFSLPLPFGLYHWSRSLTLAFGLVLIYLSIHLFQRQRVAWWLALAGTILAGLAHVGRGHTWYHALPAVVSVALLLLFRRRFTVRSEPRSIRQGVLLMLGSVFVALAYGTAGFWLLDKKDFGIDFTVGGALAHTLRELTLLGNPDLAPYTRHARWFLDSLHIVGVVAGALGFYSFFRPVAYRYSTLPRQRTIVKKLLEQYGGASDDYFKLWPDKAYFFSLDHRSCIAYKTVAGVAVSLGDPVGDPESMDQLLAGFQQYCTNNGWNPIFLQVAPDLLLLYREHDMQALKIGEDAVVNLEHFTGQTAGEKHFRYLRRKFDEAGYQTARYLPPHPMALLDELGKVSQEWLELPGRHESTFALGYFDRSYLQECPVFCVRDPEGQVLAFANEIPSYAAGEATIDMMRHRLEAPNGTMEYLFLKLLQLLQGSGYKTFNLGLAPLTGIGEDPDAPVEERAARWLAEHLSRFFSYKGLRAYKEKFEPEWQDRFLIYRGGPLGLVRAAIAIVRVTDK